MRLVLLRFLWGRLTNRHTGENRVASAVMITLGEEFLKGIGCDEIIVLIVPHRHCMPECSQALFFV